MISLRSLQQTADFTVEYHCLAPVNLYDSAQLEQLATQANRGRHLRIQALPRAEDPPALSVVLCEDGYPGWLAVADLDRLAIADRPYQPAQWSAAEIPDVIPDVIAFTRTAMSQPNIYLWGGTVAPDYDCSGLMQAAFASVGLWIPRDAYQQEAFAQPVSLDALEPGDLVFFGTPVKATHVGLYLGEDWYIHSSGKDQGHNGIGCDRLLQSGDGVSQRYRSQLRGGGRIVTAYSAGVT